MNLKRLLGLGPNELPSSEVTQEQLLAMEQAREREQTITAFIKSPVGSYLLERINADKQTALEAIAAADSWDLQTIRQAKDKYHQAASIETYLAEALIEGQSAGQMLDHINNK